jgi:DNA-binding NarL/FixJ family response regulator
MADQLQVFLSKNRDAWQFAYKASQDYLLTRLGMKNGMSSSFEMATQAIEKLLKSYLLFTDLTLGGDAEKVRSSVSAKAKGLGRKHEPGHDVEAALDLAIENGMRITAGLRSRVVRINGYYAHRYPRNGYGYPTAGLSTAEISDVDKAVFEIWDAFKAINADYYYLTHWDHESCIRKAFLSASWT